MTNLESRTFSGASIRAGESDEMALVGYVATYGTLSHDLGGFRERIANGAFDRALRENQDTRCLFNHNADKILGRRSSGTLQLASDSKGLKFRCQLDPNQQWHRDLYSSVRRGDIAECSFSFRTTGPASEVWDEAIDDEDGARFSRRTLKDVDLFDCSVVCSPAYPGTSVSARYFSPAVRSALETLSHENWRRVMTVRLEEVDKVFGDNQDRHHRQRARQIAAEIREAKGEL